MKTYKDFAEFFDFRDFYTRMVQEATPGSHFVEIGSWRGGSVIYLAEESKRLNKNLKIDAVDVWQPHPDAPFYHHGIAVYGGDLYLHFLENLRDTGNFNNIRGIKLDSHKSPTLYADESLDFVFIDGNHEYSYVKKDIQLWLPKVKKGKYLAGHDITCIPDVKRAVREVLGDKAEELVTDGGCGVWLFKK